MLKHLNTVPKQYKETVSHNVKNSYTLLCPHNYKKEPWSLPTPNCVAAALHGVERYIPFNWELGHISTVWISHTWNDIIPSMHSICKNKILPFLRYKLF